MREPSLAPAYALMYPRLCEAARSRGYALALHGTMARDLDLLAVPWVEEAVAAEDLVHALWEEAVAWLNIDGREAAALPEVKPHGRRAWVLPLPGGRGFIDVSVMPRLWT